MCCAKVSFVYKRLISDARIKKLKRTHKVGSYTSVILSMIIVVFFMTTITTFNLASNYK